MASEALNHLDRQGIEWMQQVIEGRNPFADVAEEKIQGMHALAFFLYREQQYRDASHFFRLLVASRPSEAKYWKSLGACFQMLKEYEQAINCYISAQILNKNQPDPYLYVHAADCYFVLQQKEAGLKALEAARFIAKEKNDRRILKHVALMRDLWSKETVSK
jgi:type III secretion system low calcium response chaperone LcrH/SycD